MLADPQSITIAAATTPLPRTGVAPLYSDYTSADGTISVRVQQSSNRTTKRTSIALRVAKIAADPISAVNSRVTNTVTINVTSPLDGFTVTELKDQVVGLAAILTGSSAAALVKILGGEK